MSASSDLDDPNDLGRPEHAILNNKLGSWCAYYSRAIEWLELDLGSDQTIYGVAVQGSHDSNSKVTKYIISLRANGASEDTWLFEASSVLLIGSTSKVLAIFSRQRQSRGAIRKLTAKCHLQTWFNIGSAPENDFINAHTNSKRWIGLREVPDNRMNWTDDSTEPGYVNWQTGEPVYQDDRDDCTYFSVSSGTWYTKSCGRCYTILFAKKVLATYDVSQWSSSSWKCMTKPELARLHGKPTATPPGVAASRLASIDLGQDVHVSAIFTQGARGDYGFVKSYTLSYKTSDGTWKDYNENGSITVLPCTLFN
ncbi:hypothetical protein OS493_033034 [Desmophyllum pertusum]|uniref:Uncharacterized protein n=1 Tax=Desmophyllum pertusum TaxID=174260 RepID=A0A9W9ZMG5_9CNID|nr:hypothetical protein OS493_033034 [Desmophyllum pertusum]